MNETVLHHNKKALWGIYLLKKYRLGKNMYEIVWG